MEINYIGTIVKFAFNFSPKDWEICDGRIITITQNQEIQALFSVIGNSFGGDGVNTFALPDLRLKKQDGSYYQHLEITNEGIPYLNSYICIDGVFPSDN